MGLGPGGQWSTLKSTWEKHESTTGHRLIVLSPPLVSKTKKETNTGGER